MRSEELGVRSGRGWVRIQYGASKAPPPTVTLWVGAYPMRDDVGSEAARAAMNDTPVDRGGL